MLDDVGEKASVGARTAARTAAEQQILMVAMLGSVACSRFIWALGLDAVFNTSQAGHLRFQSLLFASIAPGFFISACVRARPPWPNEPAPIRPTARTPLERSAGPTQRSVKAEA